MNQSQLAKSLREVADLIEEDYREGQTITLVSQNMVMPLDEYIVERQMGNPHNISCRGERLSKDRVTIRARWIVEGSQGKGIFQTPDGCIWRIEGTRGDPWTASSMRFILVSQEEAVSEGIVSSLQMG